MSRDNLDSIMLCYSRLYLTVLNNNILSPIVIHEEDRRAYFEALEAWDSTQELMPLINFLKEQTAKTWQKKSNTLRKRTAPIN